MDLSKVYIRLPFQWEKTLRKLVDEAVAKEREECAAILDGMRMAEEGLLERIPDSPNAVKRKQRVFVYDQIAWAIRNRSSMKQ